MHQYVEGDPEPITNPLPIPVPVPSADENLRLVAVKYGCEVGVHLKEAPIHHIRDIYLMLSNRDPIVDLPSLDRSNVVFLRHRGYDGATSGKDTTEH